MGGGGGNCQQWTGVCTTSSAISRTGKVTIGGTGNAASIYSLGIVSNDTVNFQVMPSGYVYAREIEVALDPFPDYVFEKDYELMPLEELETYIKHEKHLLNIPSAKEVDNNGVGLGELVLLQMEKIEELTLYMLEMNKKIKALEAENQKLKNINKLTNQDSE